MGLGNDAAIAAGQVSGVKLVWVQWACSCCRKQLIGFARLVPAETAPLSNRARQIVGTAICLN